MTKPVFSLVHGAWHARIYWAQVLPLPNFAKLQVHVITCIALTFIGLTLIGLALIGLGEAYLTSSDLTLATRVQACIEPHPCPRTE